MDPDLTSLHAVGLIGARFIVQSARIYLYLLMVKSLRAFYPNFMDVLMG